MFLWATKSEGVGLIVHVISFQYFQPMWSQSINVTDGQTGRHTDGQTDDMQSQDRAFHYSASRGKNYYGRRWINYETLTWKPVYTQHDGGIFFLCIWRVVVVTSPSSVFSRSYCYTVRSAIGIILLSVCPSVCLSVTLCIVALRVGVRG